jgi:hypothetical protein
MSVIILWIKHSFVHVCQKPARIEGKVSNIEII